MRYSLTKSAKWFTRYANSPIGQIKKSPCTCRLNVWLGYPKIRNPRFKNLKVCWMGHEPTPREEILSNAMSINRRLHTSNTAPIESNSHQTLDQFPHRILGKISHLFLVYTCSLKFLVVKNYITTRNSV